MATAYHLVSAGARTLLVDREDAGRATDAGAGILSPETNSRDPEAWYRLAMAAVEYYPGLVDRLRGEQAGDTGYARCGKLVVAVSDDEVGAVRAGPAHHLRAPAAPGRAAARRACARYPPAEARDLFPALAPVPGRHLLAGRGARRRPAPQPRASRRRRGPRSRHPSGERGSARASRGGAVKGLVVGGETVAAGAVAIAGGAWSEAFGRQLGVAIPGGAAARPDHPPRPPRHRHDALADGQRLSPALPRGVAGPVAWWRARRARRAPASRRARPPPACARSWTRRCGWRRGWRRPRCVRSVSGFARSRRTRCPVLGAVPGVRGVFLNTGHGPSGLTLGPL